MIKTTWLVAALFVLGSALTTATTAAETTNEGERAEKKQILKDLMEALHVKTDMGDYAEITKRKTDEIEKDSSLSAEQKQSAKARVIEHDKLKEARLKQLLEENHLPSVSDVFFNCVLDQCERIWTMDDFRKVERFGKVAPLVNSPEMKRRLEALDGVDAKINEQLKTPLAPIMSQLDTEDKAGKFGSPTPASSNKQHTGNQ